MKAIVEIPAGSRYKYEIKDNKLVLDRVLNQPVPFNYGYFPGTVCGDGDPLDVFIMSKEPIPSGTEVKLSIVGGFNCKDNNLPDDKLIAVLEGEENYHDVGFSTKVIRRYLTTYKEGFELCGTYTLEQCLNEYKDSHE